MEDAKKDLETSQQSNVRTVLLLKLKFNRKIIAIIILIIITIVIVIIVLNIRSKKVGLSDNQIVISDQAGSQKNNTIPTLEDMGNWQIYENIEDWQTYTDNSVGVTVKFPKNWYIHYDALSPGHFDISNVSQSDRFNSAKWDTPEVKNRSSFTINLTAYDNTLPVERWYNQYFYKKPISIHFEKSLVTIKDLTAIEIKTEKGEVFYFVSKGGHVVRFRFNYTNEEYLKIYQTILLNIEVFEIPIPNGSYIISNKNIFSQPIETTIIEDTTYAHPHNFIENPEGGGVNGEQIIISPQGQRYVIADKIDKQIGYIIGIVPNPNDNNTVFISASNYSTTTEAGLSICPNKIYTYNLENGDLVELYSEISENNSPMGSTFCRILRACGTQGSKLILQTDDPVNSPHPCLSPWSSYNKHFLYLELSDIESGLKTFTVPDYKIKEGEEFESRCMQELEKMQ